MSPYDFVGGNPINRVDPNGMDWYKVENDSSTTYVWRDSQDKTVDIDGVTYENAGVAVSIKAGGSDLYLNMYQNYLVGTSKSEIDVNQLVLNNQRITNQLLNKLDGKYANVLFAQAVNHAINTDGTKTALLTLSVPASIIGAAEAIPLLYQGGQTVGSFGMRQLAQWEYWNGNIWAANQLYNSAGYWLTNTEAGAWALAVLAAYAPDGTQSGFNGNQAKEVLIKFVKNLSDLNSKIRKELLNTEYSTSRPGK